MSFQDIILNNNNQWQIGYTGTAYLELNNYKKYGITENVFSKIIIDPDEKIEIILALNKYGYTNENNIINLNNFDVDTLIDNIIEQTKDNPRGYVDLAGLLINYDNKIIAKKFAEKLAEKKLEKRIIYFNKNNDAIEYNKISSIEYRGIHNDNFYYYDQSHIIGTDLKQPQFGHFTISINSNTRMTDFAQAIFRFRKLNRGTYMSIIFVDPETKFDKTNQIYELLNNNEERFKQNQKIGLQYQLLKAITRKESKNYIEDSLQPIYLQQDDINKEYVINYIYKNIKGLETSKNLSVIKLKDELLLNLEQLSSIIFDNTKDTEQQFELEKQQEQQQEQEQEKQKEIQQFDDTNNKKFIHKFGIGSEKMFIIKNCYIIKHLNCLKCKLESSYKLFNTKIEEKDKDKYIKKDIYISYNLLYIEFKKFSSFSNETIVSAPNENLCFIEFNDYILIEKENIGVNYYLTKLPVYDRTGLLMLPTMCNKLNTEESRYKLNINPIIFKLLGININTTIKDGDIISCIDNLTPLAKIILKFHYITCKVNKYDLHSHMISQLNKLDTEYKINYDYFDDELPPEFPLFMTIDYIVSKCLDEGMIYDIYNDDGSTYNIESDEIIDKVDVFKEMEENKTIYLEKDKEKNREIIIDKFIELFPLKIKDNTIQLRTKLQEIIDKQINYKIDDYKNYLDKLSRFNERETNYIKNQNNHDLYRIHKQSLGEHNITDENNLYYRHYNFNSSFNNLELNDSGYANISCLHKFIYYYNDYHTLNQISKLNYLIKKTIPTPTDLSGGNKNNNKYYKKYLKYKQKYINLKIAYKPYNYD